MKKIINVKYEIEYEDSYGNKNHDPIIEKIIDERTHEINLEQIMWDMLTCCAEEDEKEWAPEIIKVERKEITGREV